MAWKTSSASRRRLRQGLLVAILLTVLAPAVQAQPAADPGRVPWTFFALQAERLGNRITTEVRIATLPAAAERARFLPGPKGVPFSPSGPELLKLSVTIVIEILGRQPVRIESHVWFDPRDGTPLFRIRTRSGVDDYHQLFWFTREGVFRRQREPASPVEAARPPESWTKLGEHFYPYGPAAPGCPQVLESSILIYLLSATPITEKEGAPSVCVFHKRHLHRVSFYPETAKTVSVDFLEKTPAGRKQMLRRDAGTENSDRIAAAGHLPRRRRRFFRRWHAPACQPGRTAAPDGELRAAPHRADGAAAERNPSEMKMPDQPRLKSIWTMRSMYRRIVPRVTRPGRLCMYSEEYWGSITGFGSSFQSSRLYPMTSM